MSRVYEHDVNVKDARGDWAPIDTALSKTSSGDLVSGDGSPDLQLPSALSDGPVTLSKGDDSVSLSLEGAGDAAAQVSGNSATYASVADGVSAKLFSTTTGVKEDLVLSAADSQNTFAYKAKLSDGLSLKATKDGGAVVVNGSGDVVFSIAAPVAYDASGQVAPTSATSLTIDGDAITVSLDQSWLSAAGRSFPVTLDPSTNAVLDHDCYLDGQNTTTSYCTGADLWVGSSSGHDHRSILHFNVAGQIPEAANVQEATLNLYATSQTSPGVSKNLAVHALTNSFDDNATWVKRNATASWANPGGDYAAADLDTQPVPATHTWSSWDITDTVNGWLNAGGSNQTTNYGLAVTDDGSTANNSVIYQSFDSPYANDPYLQIDWWPRTGQPGDATILRQPISSNSSLGVNVAGGNLLLSSSDLHVDSTGLPVDISRFYNSQDPWDGTLGSKGRIGIGNDMVLQQDSHLGDYELITGDGGRYRFVPTGGGSYKTPPGAGNVTLKDTAGGRHELTDNNSGIVYGFYNNPYAYMDTIKDQYGNQLTLEYHGTNNTLSKITDQRGRSFTTTTNSSGFITSITAPAIAATSDHLATPAETWTYGYGGAGGDLLSTVTDPVGNVTHYYYTSDGRDLLTKITDARGHDTNIAYNSDSEVTSITRVVDGTTAHDATTTFSYRTSGFDIACPTALPAGITTGETTVTQPNSVNDASFKATKYCFNQEGQVIYTVDGNGKPTSNQYNAQGNSSLFAGFAGTSGAGTTTVQYDGLGQNPKEIDSAAGTINKATYPTTPGQTDLAASRPLNSTDPQGKVTTYGYNTQGDLTSASTGAHLQASLAYNTNGTLHTAADGNSNTTTYGYNASGELTTVTPQPLAPNTGTQMAATTYTYDGLSRVSTISNGITGNLQTLSYDKDNRVTSIVDSDGKTLTLGYDADGNVTSRTEGTNTTSYVFDALNRKTSETFPSSATNTYTYDNNGNLTSLTDPNGTDTYTYEAANRIKSVTSPSAGSGTDPTTFDWKDPSTPSYTDATHTLETETLPGGATIKQTRDLDGKLTDVIVQNGTTQTAHRTYTWAAGSVKHDVLDSQVDYGTGTTPVTTTAYAYGDNDMLAEAQTVNGTIGGSNVRDDQLTYDAAGNRTVRTTTLGTGSPTSTYYAYNNDNQLCWQAPTSAACGPTAPTGATSYTYDKAGEQLTGGQTMAWDAKNRLKTLNSGSVTTLSPTNAEVTAVGSTGYHNTVLGTTKINASGSIYALVRDPGSGAVISQVAGGTKLWYVTDQLGSTIALVDKNGAVQRGYNYDIDGNATTYGSGPGTYVTYAGGIDVGGVIHFGQRYYAPSEARWTQADQLDSPADLTNANRYLYVGSNPVSGTDPDGLFLDGLRSRVSNAWTSTKHWVKNTTAGRCVGGAIVTAVSTGTAIAVTAASDGAAGPEAASTAAKIDGAAAGGCLGGATSKAIGL